MTTNAVEIFRQLGFVAGDGCLTRTLSAGDNSSVAEIRDAATSDLPTASTERFEVRLVNPALEADWRGPQWIELRDAGLDDAVALAVAEANDILVRTGDWPREELVFSDDGTAYSNAFADQQYGDWVGDRDRRNVWVLRNPESLYGKLYLDWRASIMAKAEAGELGPLLAVERGSLRI